MPDLFSPAWADALCAGLNASAEYRRAAATWEGALAFVARADPAPRAVWLDLHHGACRSALAGPDAAARDAPFTIEAALAVWQDVLSGRLDPLTSMMLGKMTVTGNMSTLAAHAASAKVLFAHAAAIETT